jgi:hypothetical protein
MEFSNLEIGERVGLMAGRAALITQAGGFVGLELILLDFSLTGQ